VCDYELCCDGSDEWAGVGDVKCEDRCAKIGKEWRKQDDARQKSIAAANKRRRELVAEAGRLRKEVEDRIGTLRTQVRGQEVKVEALEKELGEVERLERGRVVRSKGPGKGGKIVVLAELAKGRIAELVGGLERVRRERDGIRARMVELEGILATFKEERNPNFNDEGVKRAVKAWEDYAARDKGQEVDAAHDRDVDEMLKSDAENGINWEEFESVEESDVEVCKSRYYFCWIDLELIDYSIQIRRVPPQASQRLG
jgi:protein kinase C substrate 80K-H